MSKSYTKKAITIQAIQWKGDNFHKVMNFAIDEKEKVTNVRLEDLIDIPEGENPPRKIIVSTLEGDLHASINDYIIKGIKGEFYPCKPDIFEASYDSNETVGKETLGKYRVGLSFNPSKNEMVDKIKSKAAELIDLIESVKPVDSNGELDELTPLGEEIRRLAILSQDQIESAAMFAVKAATKQ